MFLTCPNLAALPNIRHGFFTRKGGSSTGLYASLNCGYGSGDDIAVVAENRDKVADALSVKNDALCTAFQIHSTNVVTLGEPWHWGESPEADALVTNTPGIALGILTADCLPILFASKSVIGAAHAGWKGAFNGVIEATLAAMRQLGAINITATIGPAIAQSSYEVGTEFYDRFIQQGTTNKKYFIPGTRPEHYQFDLKTYAHDRLLHAGIGKTNILPQDTCALADDFFSFRRATLQGEKAYGRQISAIALM